MFLSIGADEVWADCPMRPYGMIKWLDEDKYTSFFVGGLNYLEHTGGHSATWDASFYELCNISR